MASISGDLYSKIALMDKQEVDRLLKNLVTNDLIALFQTVTKTSVNSDLTGVISDAIILRMDELNPEQLASVNTLFLQIYPSGILEGTTSLSSLDNIGRLIRLVLKNNNTDLLNSCFEAIEKETGIRPSTNAVKAIEIKIEKPVDQEKLNRLSNIISAIQGSDPSVNIQITLMQFHLLPIALKIDILKIIDSDLA